MQRKAPLSSIPGEKREEGKEEPQIIGFQTRTGWLCG